MTEEHLLRFRHGLGKAVITDSGKVRVGPPLVQAPMADAGNYAGCPLKHISTAHDMLQVQRPAALAFFSEPSASNIITTNTQVDKADSLRSRVDKESKKIDPTRYKSKKKKSRSRQGSNLQSLGS
jgi:hypothetical protein